MSTFTNRAAQVQPRELKLRPNEGNKAIILQTRKPARKTKIERKEVTYRSKWIEERDSDRRFVEHLKASGAATASKVMRVEKSGASLIGEE